MDWVELTDEDAERLVRTITRAKDYAKKMAVLQEPKYASEQNS